MVKLGEKQAKSRGQAMVEYALIMALLAIAMGVAIAATGPAIGNVFCNVVDNIGGTTVNPQGGNCGARATELAGAGGAPPLFWATVTWIATHPQGETPFPTAIRRAPTSANVPDTATPTWTFTPTDTPTPSDTPTNTPTSTPTDTPTPGPSATNSDLAFTIPHIDQISKPEWWRLDSSYWLDNTATWNGQWHNNLVNGSDSVNWSVDTLAAGNSVTYLTSDLNMSWGGGSPPSATGITNTDNYGAIFTRSINLSQSATIVFNLTVSDYGRLKLDGTQILAGANGTFQTTQTISAAAHTLTFEYGDNSSANAGFSLTTTVNKVNLDDTTVGNNICTWGQNNAGGNAVSQSFQFEDNPEQATWTGGQTCNLELRGYIDTSGHSHPTLSFWDIWDFAAASNLTAQLQVGDYITDASGNLLRGSLNWRTINLHNPGTQNYAWTRNQIDLSTIAGLTNHVAVRFVIGSSSPGTPFRWYIDDLEVLDGANPTKTFTVGNSWDLNNRSQMTDFVFDGDSNKLIEDNVSTQVPDTREQYRWDLTSTHAHGGTAWDDSPGYNYQAISGLVPASPSGSAQARVHFLEFKYPINLVSAPIPDPGHAGVPLLTFWQAFDIKPGASIRVEYTTDPVDLATDTWIPVPNQGVLIDYAIPAGTSRTNLTMQPVSIDLSAIPVWNTQPFRLRFALYVDSSASSFGDGWYIDDIKLDRQVTSPFVAYPFIDDAEVPSFTAANWNSIGNKWGPTTEKGGALNSATAYSDSPLTQYDPNDEQILQMTNWIDLLHDTPTNTTDASGRLAAVNPILTFWHQRDLGPGVKLWIEMQTPENPTWTSIWLYDSDADTSFKTQKAWERVEINLVTALQQITSQTWNTISTNGILDDDDIRIRFRFDTGSGTANDGVYVDQIHIQDAPLLTQKLWAPPTGSGSFVDSVEVAVPSIGGISWDKRWYAGGQWNTTSTYRHSGSLALTDSPGGNYGANTFSVLELIPTIDMTDPSMTAALHPTMFFWTRYQVGSTANVRVEIASDDPADPSLSSQVYNKIGGWSAWNAQPMMIGDSVSDAGSNTLNNTQIMTWEQGQIDLSSFVGHRIRVRFVVSFPASASPADGIYLDDVAFKFNPRLINDTGTGTPKVPFGFIDNAQSTANWTAEGIWGLGTNYFTTSGSGDLGSGSWTGTYYDCEKLGYSNCDQPTTYATMLVDHPGLQPSDPFNATDPTQPIGPEVGLTSINFNWGTTN